MFFVSETVVERLMTLTDAIAAVEAAYRGLAVGTAEVFPVATARGFIDGERWALKSGADRASGALGFKVGNYWPGNAARGVAPHGSTTMLLNPETGFAHAVIGASQLTALRTAAADAVAVKYLARANSQVLTVVGAGHQAGWDARAVSEVRELTDIRICSRTAERANALVEELVREGLPARVMALEEAIRTADIIVTATPSRGALFEADWVRPGTHVSAMGADAPGKQELPVALLERAELFCDVRAQSLEIGEFQTAVHEQRVAPERITPVGEVIAGMAAGRSGDEAITVFDSSGMALQDLALAAKALRLAQDAGEAMLLPD